MKQANITVNGVEYPVVFTMKTILSFEEITEKSFFVAKLDNFSERIAIVVSAILSANENADIDFEKMASIDSLEGLQEFMQAFGTVMELQRDFFHLPGVEKKDNEDKAEKKGKKEKN